MNGDGIPYTMTVPITNTMTDQYYYVRSVLHSCDIFNVNLLSNICMSIMTFFNYIWCSEVRNAGEQLIRSNWIYTLSVNRTCLFPLSIIIIILCSLDKMILIVAPPIISESGTIINAGSDPYIGLHITSINAMMNMKIR